MPKRIPKNIARNPAISKRPATFEEAILFFRVKSKEAVEDAICLTTGDPSLDSESLRRLIVAWPKLNLSKITMSADIPEDDNAIWQWLWAQVSYDKERLRKIAAVGANIDSLLEILIGNHLLYPDGTVNEWAQRVVRQVLKSQLGI